MHQEEDSISLSIMEAEYKALTLTIQECVSLQRLAKNSHLSISKPTTICGDNQCAIKLANNSIFHARTKHIEVKRYHFIREKALDRTLYTRRYEIRRILQISSPNHFQKLLLNFLAARLG